MLSHFGWRAVTAIIMSTLVYFILFRRELVELAGLPRLPMSKNQRIAQGELLDGAVPAWITVVHMEFMAWTVFTAHYPALFVGGFWSSWDSSKRRHPVRATWSSKVRYSAFFSQLWSFTAGYRHGGSRRSSAGYPRCRCFSARPFNRFNDNALITFLATLVPNLNDHLKAAVVEGAVTGGGFTVIANAPNPAGQALLGRFFGGAILPIRLLLGALVPTIIASIAFSLFYVRMRHRSVAEWARVNRSGSRCRDWLMIPRQMVSII